MSTEHSPSLLSSLRNSLPVVRIIAALVDLVRSMFFARRYPISEPDWPVDVIVPLHAKTTKDLLWQAHCPRTGRDLGTYEDRADAEASVWEAMAERHGA